MLVLVASRTQPADGRDPARDAELVRVAQRGSTDAQAQLFRLHAPRLLPMLRRLLASTSDAEDALQDTFVAAFTELSDLREPALFAGWLRRIAVHQAHRRFRRRKLLGFFGLSRHEEDARLAEEASPAATPEMIAELTRIDRVLAALPGHERTAWVLRHVEGHELTEVADACDCSLATVKRWIDRAETAIAKWSRTDG